MRSTSALAVVTLTLATPAVAAPLSALDPAGRDATVIAALFWWMAVVSAVVWVAALALLFYCVRAGTGTWRRPRADRLIFWAGLVVPTVLLTAWLVRALPHVGGVVDTPPAAGAFRVHVTGEQWWWRVRYEGPDGVVESANEVRLPLGRTTHVVLDSDNVIHAFWVPSLAGKIDLVPGRSTVLTLEPTTLGRFRGVCAEYCGASHARMHFEVVVLEPDAFAAWLEEAAAPAAAPVSTAARDGAVAFQASGCGACHRIRGTAASGGLGPDLTHAADRFGVVDMAPPIAGDPLTFWLRHPHVVKPGARMPPFDALGDVQLAALSAYLRELP